VHGLTWTDIGDTPEVDARQARPPADHGVLEASCSSGKAVPADVIISHHRCDRRARRLEHLVSRNSDNSSYPSSRDGQPGRPEPKPKKSRASGGGQRGRGGQPGAPLKCSVWDGTRSRVFGNARSS